MVELIISAVIVLVIMFLFTFSMFKNIIRRIGDNSKKYFIDKLQDYNYIIEEKERELEILKSEIKDINKVKLNNTKEKQEDNEQEDEEKLLDIPFPEYREDTFFYNYKQLKRKFDIDVEKILKEFIKTHNNSKDKKIYEILENFKNNFNQESIYECLTLSSEEQLQLVEEIIDEEEQKIIGLDEISKKEKNFNILKLMEYIDKKMEEIDPTIYVYIGSHNYSYDYLGENIKTEFYKNMSEGIIIKYRDKIYDYSI